MDDLTILKTQAMFYTLGLVIGAVLTIAAFIGLDLP